MRCDYPAIFTPCLEKDGFTVEVPDQGKDIPKSSNLSDIIVKDGSFKQLLILDLKV